MNSKISIHQLAEGVGTEAHVTAITAQLIIKELFDLAATTLEAGEEFEIKGIGRFRNTGIADNPVGFQPAEEFAKAVNAPFDMFAPQPLSAPMDELDAIDRQTAEGLPTEATGVAQIDIAADIIAPPCQTDENMTMTDEKTDNLPIDNGADSGANIMDPNKDEPTVTTEAGKTSKPNEADTINSYEEYDKETILPAAPAESKIPSENLENIETEIVTEDKDKVDCQKVVEEIVKEEIVNSDEEAPLENSEDKTDEDSNEDYTPTVTVPPAFSEQSVNVKAQSHVQPPAYNPLPPFPEEEEEQVTNSPVTISATTYDLSTNGGEEDVQEEEEETDTSNQEAGQRRSSSRFGIGFATGLIVGIAVGALAMFILFLAMTRMESDTVVNTEEIEKTEQAVEKPAVRPQPETDVQPDGLEESNPEPRR